MMAVLFGLGSYVVGSAYTEISKDFIILINMWIVLNSGIDLILLYSSWHGLVDEKINNCLFP